jgi:membrane-associated phospholipid phosphatase
MRVRRRRSAARAALALVLATSSVLAPRTARATDPPKVKWAEDWPRVRWWEGLDIVALTVGSSVIAGAWDPHAEPQWRGGILFDDAVRSALRGRSPGVQQTAADMSDYFYKGGVLAPYVIDVYIVALGIHQSPDVALQMTLMNLQSLGLTGVVSLASERAVGRARPYVGDCGADGAVRDPSGRPLLNTCGTGGDTESFYSGHSAATATMAGLTCAHHQHMPLYGGGFADLAPCLAMIGVSAATGVTRIVADRHWASDVVIGWSVGALSGYVLPSFLHYGFGAGGPALEIRYKGAVAVPTPQVYAGGAGAGFVGVF